MLSSTDSDLEAFSHNPTDGSFAPLSFQASANANCLNLQFLYGTILYEIWNEMPVSLRKLPKNAFKRKIKQTLFAILASEDCYIELPEIVQ